jgi:hypothetical protein
MLIVRTPQLAALQVDADARFCRQMVGLLRAEVAAVAQLADAQIEARCAAALARADAYGLTRDQDVLAFVTLTFTVAPDFDQRPAFQAILAAKGQGGAEKMRRLFTVEPRHFAGVTGESWSGSRDAV